MRIAVFVHRRSSAQGHCEIGVSVVRRRARIRVGYWKDRFRAFPKVLPRICCIALGVARTSPRQWASHGLEVVLARRAALARELTTKDNLTAGSTAESARPASTTATQGGSMGSQIGIEVDLRRYATEEEIGEEDGGPPTLDPSAPVEEPSEAPADAGPGGGGGAGGPAAGHVAGTWLPHTTRHLMPILDHGPRPQTRGLVIHVNDGYFDGTISWFSGGSRGVGAHLEIGGDRVWQLLSLERKAW